MDNQQATSEELAWLAGIVDGEGSLLFLFNGHNGSYEGRNIIPTLYITNTCGNLIEHCVTIIQRLGINPHIHTTPAKTDRKVCYRLDVSRYESLKIIVEALLPHLRSKAGHARLMLRFLKTREGKKRRPFEAETHAILDEYFEKFGYRKHSKPQRLNVAPAHGGEDKVRPAAGNSAEA